jgi:signal transduction histidine kinase
LKFFTIVFTEWTASLYQESVINRVFGGIRIFRWHPFDDNVKALKSRPLGMFFYNQRAIFMGFGLIYLAALALIAWNFRWAENAEALKFTVEVLGTFWLIDFFITLLLHISFVKRINRWAASPVTYAYPPIFDVYFFLDSLLVLALIWTGKKYLLNLDAFVSLLFVNTVVYSSAYVRGGSQKKGQIITVLVFQAIVIGLLLFGTKIDIGEPRLFDLVLNLSVFVGMALTTVLSVLMISWLRNVELEISDRRLGLLSGFERLLSETPFIVSSTVKAQQPAFSEAQFRTQVKKVLENLCTQGYPFWYDSACLWFFEKHQDRGNVLLLGTSVNFSEAHRFKDGIHDPDPLLLSDVVITVASLKQHSTEGDSFVAPKLHQTLDAPAAFVPLIREGNKVGIIALYGKEDGTPLLYEEKTFLWTLASIICNTMEQWEGRYKLPPLREMDEVFACGSLEEMFPKAVKTLKKYLEASGCMLIFRANPSEAPMEVRAVAGFSKPVFRKDYLAGVGQTGKCAGEGIPIKWDNVQNHLDEFDSERLEALEKALGKKIVSWMAIPIGKAPNFGVIKVVNSTMRCPWFTAYDEELGILLAQRLLIMIEKFLHIKEIEEQLKEIEISKERAQRSATEAKGAQQKAEEAARQRQDDLMIITHQLQAPLNSVISGVTLMQRANTDKRLDFIRGFIEDALALCFGTFTTFAREAGRETAFSASNIDAPAALRKLCKRLQMTNAREDLRFRFHAEPGFPRVRMDWRVFTSVFFSLIHNAMKYAEKYSHVTLECSFERATGRAALKVRSIGEPIQSDEKETIFEKYGRGRVITKTGRYHSGVGLGLWVARELMRAVGGDLTVELSESQPDLSVFVVLAPPSD